MPVLRNQKLVYGLGLLFTVSGFSYESYGSATCLEPSVSPHSSVYFQRSDDTLPSRRCPAVKRALKGQLVSLPPETLPLPLQNHTQLDQLFQELNAQTQAFHILPTDMQKEKAPQADASSVASPPLSKRFKSRNSSLSFFMNQGLNQENSVSPAQLSGFSSVATGEANPSTGFTLPAPTSPSLSSYRSPTSSFDFRGQDHSLSPSVFSTPKQKRNTDQLRPTPSTQKFYASIGFDDSKQEVARAATLAIQGVNLSPSILSSSKKIANAVQAIKAEFPETAQKPEVRQAQLLSPALRLAGADRRQVAEAREQGRVRSLAVDYHLPEEQPLTEEERQNLKKELQDHLEQLQAQQGFTSQSLSDVQESEVEIWRAYMQWNKKSKEAVLQEGAPKIRREGIELAFDTLVGQRYQCFGYEGYKVFYNPAYINLDLPNLEGTSNRHLLSIGNCPLGADNKLMNFHHITHHDPGYLVLISGSLHSQYHDELHYYSSVAVMPRKRVDRVVFGNYRQEICKYLLEVTTQKLSTNTQEDL